MRLLTRSTPPFVDPAGRLDAQAIACLDRPRLNGIRQGVLVRGRDTGNPGLLILHGGPGGAYIGMARHWFGPLEDRWVVVNWDERGAGLSYVRRHRDQPLTPELLVRDALAVVDWLRQEHSVSRLYLLGHSFGTLLAPFLLEAAPREFAGYFSVSTAPTDLEGEAESYDWRIARARAIGHRNAVRALEQLGSPPYPPESAGLTVRAGWTDRLGGAIEGTTGDREAFAALRRGTEYTWSDALFRLQPGIRCWMRNVDPRFTERSLVDRFPTLPVPVAFVGGDKDFMAPIGTARRYCASVSAPWKRLFELPRVGHYPFVEAPARFTAVVQPGVFTGEASSGSARAG